MSNGVGRNDVGGQRGLHTYSDEAASFGEPEASGEITRRDTEFASEYGLADIVDVVPSSSVDDLLIADMRSLTGSRHFSIRERGENAEKEALKDLTKTGSCQWMRYNVRMALDPLTSLLICPRNDVESREIVKLAEGFGVPTVVSEQAHGAKLDLEPNLIDRIRTANPIAHDIVVVEMPSMASEDRLRELGFDVHVVDHHRYESLDRMKSESSLEQFRALFAFDDIALTMAGFDPVLVKGVGLIDRGFVWELAKEGVPEADRKRMIAYYREETAKLGTKRKEEEAEAKKVWKKRRMDGDVIIVESNKKDLSIRDAISFLVAEEFPAPPVTVVYQPNRVIYVQETDTALALHQTFGGFTFGQNRCWGRAIKDGALPSLEEVLAAHRLAIVTR